MKRNFLTFFSLFFTMSAVVCAGTIPEYFLKEEVPGTVGIFRNIVQEFPDGSKHAYCARVNELPEGYELALETEYERVKRILAKHKTGLFSVFGLPVAQGIYMYTEHCITEKIKDKPDKTEARRALRENFCNAMANNARLTISLTGIYAVIGIFNDYKFEKRKLILVKKTEEQEIKS